MSAPGSDYEVEQTLEELGIGRSGGRPQGGVPQPPISPSAPSRLPPALQEAADVKAQLEQNPGIRDLLFRLMDLVDRYWNGAKSLHKNAKFKGLALGLVQGFMQGDGDQGTRELALLREQVERLRSENGALREQHNKVKAAFVDSSGNEAHLRSSLQKAFQDVEKLKHQVQLCNAENEKLHRRLQAESSAPGGGATAAHPPAAAAATSVSTQHNQSLDELQRQNDGLQREVDALRIRLKQYAQMQELAAMLQDSHKSLVQTNDHLLREMDEARHRHSHEVTQMQWNYDQLKKTMSMASRNTSMASTSRSLHNGQASHS